MVRILYLLIVYKNVEQVIRLVRRLNGPNIKFLIHVDRRTDDSFVERLRAAVSDHADCEFLPRIPVRWGGWGLAQVTLNAVRQVVERSIPGDFLVYMSGQDYPLKANREITAFFAANRGRQFMEVFSMPYAHWPGRGGMNRIDVYHFHFRRWHWVYPPYGDQESLPLVMERLKKVLPFTSRRLPHGYKPYGGSAAVILARNAIEYIAEFTESAVGREIVRFFRMTRHPDEIFFQTVIMNSALRDTVVNDELRYVDWSGGGAHPAILTRKDFDRLVDSGKLFARKFDTTVDAEILDMLDEHRVAGAYRAM